MIIVLALKFSKESSSTDHKGSCKVFHTEHVTKQSKLAWFEVAKTSVNRLRKVKNIFPNRFIHEKITSKFKLDCCRGKSDTVSSVELSYSTTPTVLMLFSRCLSVAR